jgi:hypothetical protein
MVRIKADRLNPGGFLPRLYLLYAAGLLYTNEIAVS